MVSGGTAVPGNGSLVVVGMRTWKRMSHVTDQSDQVPAVRVFSSLPHFLCTWQIRALMLSPRRSNAVARSKFKCMSLAC
jgi:hypothetical protein